LDPSVPHPSGLFSGSSGWLSPVQPSFFVFFPCYGCARLLISFEEEPCSSGTDAAPVLVGCAMTESVRFFFHGHPLFNSSMNWFLAACRFSLPVIFLPFSGSLHFLHKKKKMVGIVVWWRLYPIAKSSLLIQVSFPSFCFFSLSLPKSPWAPAVGRGSIFSVLGPRPVSKGDKFPRVLSPRRAPCRVS